MSDHPGKILRAKIAERRALIAPGAVSALSAWMIQDLGFEAVYITGAGVTNEHFGLPDHGFIGLTDVVQQTALIRDAVELPLIVDVDTGFGNAVNVYRTIRMLERAGANAIQLEDQDMPKKCGHFSGKEVVSTAEMVGKIKAAADARHSEDFLIIARTDSRAVHGFEPAMERAQAFIDAGADITFVEAPESLEEIRQIPKRLSVPQVLNIVIGGKTPAMDQQEIADLGFGLVLYANAALQGAMRGMALALGTLKAKGRLDEDPAIVTPFQERQRLVRKPFFDALEKKYAAD